MKQWSAVPVCTVCNTELFDDNGQPFGLDTDSVVTCSGCKSVLVVEHYSLYSSTLALPDDAEVLRASGEVLCSSCGKLLRDHKRFAYKSGMGSCVQGCDGLFYHL